MNYDKQKYRELSSEDIIAETDFMLTESGPMQVGGSWPGQRVGNCGYAFLRERSNERDSHIEAVADHYGIKTGIGKRALELAIQSIQLLDAKQLDYGSANIAAFGEYGVLVRVWDKVSRLRNLLGAGKTPKNESIMDSWVDLGNYAIIAQICRRGEWK